MREAPERQVREAVDRILVKAMSVLIRDIRRVLKQGGHVEFTWLTSSATLVTANGKRRKIDGRSYQAFQNALGRSVKVYRIETGSTETKDLMIKWWDSDVVKKGWESSDQSGGWLRC